MRDGGKREEREINSLVERGEKRMKERGIHRGGEREGERDE